jgi:hypothetical protein
MYVLPTEIAISNSFPVVNEDILYLICPFTLQSLQEFKNFDGVFGISAARESEKKSWK